MQRKPEAHVLLAPKRNRDVPTNRHRKTLPGTGVCVRTLSRALRAAFLRLFFFSDGRKVGAVSRARHARRFQQTTPWIRLPLRSDAAATTLRRRVAGVPESTLLDTGKSDSLRRSHRTSCEEMSQAPLEPCYEFCTAPANRRGRAASWRESGAVHEFTARSSVRYAGCSAGAGSAGLGMASRFRWRQGGEHMSRVATQI